MIHELYTAALKGIADSEQLGDIDSTCLFWCIGLAKAALAGQTDRAMSLLRELPESCRPEYAR